MASIPLDIRLTKDQWDGQKIQNHPQEARLNFIVNKRLTDIQSALMVLSLSPDFNYKDANELKEAVLDAVFPGKEKKDLQKKDLFAPFYRAFQNERKSEGTRTIYDRAFRWIEQYDPNIGKKTFQQLDKTWLKGLDQAMGKSNTKNSRSILLRSVRAVFNSAKEMGIIQENPFKGYDLKQEPTAKRSMSVDTLRKIRDTEVAPWQEEYRDLFMLMFYMIGINAADLFLAKKEQLIDGRLTYLRKKTGKQYSIKIQPEAMAIIKKYEGKDWLLCPMDRYANYKDYLQHMNRALSTLGKCYSTSSKVTGNALFPELSTYWARHTWATLAYEIGIPIDTIGQALGHSDRQHAVTFVYIRTDDKIVDEANRKVLDYLKKSSAKEKKVRLRNLTAFDAPTQIKGK